MMFHEELRKSLDEMNCTQKELAEAGNLPASTVNRYVSGKRVPEQRSEQLEKILDGLQILSNRKKYTGFSRENFYKILEKQLEITSFDYERFRKNLNMLIDTLEIKVSKMTKERTEATGRSGGFCRKGRGIYSGTSYCGPYRDPAVTGS